MTMDRAVRIAHISDLHCDSSKAWKNNYDALNKALLEAHPDIVIATGDMVETPSEEHYQSLTSAIGETMAALADSASPFYWITVPGNHDLYKKGNRILNVPGLAWQSFVGWLSGQDNAGRSTLFQRNAGKLVYPRDEPILHVCELIYSAYNIALYPFDSNGKSIDIAFAEGKVNNIKQDVCRP